MKRWSTYLLNRIKKTATLERYVRDFADRMLDKLHNGKTVLEQQLERAILIKNDSEKQKIASAIDRFGIAAQKAIYDKLSKSLDDAKIERDTIKNKNFRKVINTAKGQLS